MNVEQRTREFCPFAGEEVTVVRLFSVENGGGCQLEISTVEVICARGSECSGARTCPDCLVSRSFTR